MSKKIKTADRPVRAEGKAGVLLFGRMNYILMLAGIALIALGFVLMSGTEDIFSPVKITVAPLVVLAGFVVEVFAIFYKAADKQADGDN